MLTEEIKDKIIRKAVESISDILLVHNRSFHDLAKEDRDILISIYRQGGVDILEETMKP
jgi:hypothetical protein